MQIFPLVVMGVIKDGTISGYLPSAETFAVHFPGYPSSSSRAMDALGGSEGILKVRILVDSAILQ